MQLGKLPCGGGQNEFASLGEKLSQLGSPVNRLWDKHLFAGTASAKGWVTLDLGSVGLSPTLSVDTILKK